MKKSKLILVVGIIFVLCIAAVIFFQGKGSDKVSPEVKKVQQEMLANCKYDADFCRYAANGIVALSSGYTMTSESTYNGKVSKTIMKSDGKENSESITYSDGKEEGSFISLDKTTYMKGPGEKEWTEFPPTKDETGKPTTNLFDFESLKKELGNATKDATESFMVKRVGTEKCGKETCVIFEMSDKTSPVTTKIWVDTSAYLARKMESKSKDGVSTMTFEYGSVTISKPSPVRKMPAFNPSTNTEGSTVSPEDIQKLMKQVVPTSRQTSEPVVATPAE